LSIKPSAPVPNGQNATVSTLSTLNIANDGGPLPSRVYYGTLNLADNDMIIFNGAASIAGYADMARAGLYSGPGGYWDGTGLASTTAYNDYVANGDHLLGLGVIPNDYMGSAIYSDFDGQTVGNTDLLVKMTYMGDLDLSGVVDAIDIGLFGEGLDDPLKTGWLFGDLDYSGAVDAIDIGFLGYALDNQRYGSLPEPGTIGLLVVGGMLALLRRRRRRA
jgi:hypothetical protein